MPTCLDYLRGFNVFLWEGSVRANISRSIIVNSFVLFAYRLIVFVSLLSLYIWNVEMIHNPVQPLKFFTIWGHFFTMFYFGAVVLQYFRKIFGSSRNNNSSGDEASSMNVRRKHVTNRLDCIGNVLFEIAITLEFPITVVWWTVLSRDPVTKAKLARIEGLTEFNIIIHCFCYASLWIDFVFNTIRCIWRHFYFILGVSTIYLVENFFVTKFGSPVYRVIMEWNSWKTPVTILAIFVMLYVHHKVICLIYFLLKYPKMLKDGYVAKEFSVMEGGQDELSLPTRDSAAALPVSEPSKP